MNKTLKHYGLDTSCQRCGSTDLKIRQKTVYTENIQFKVQCESCGKRHNAIKHDIILKILARFDMRVSDIPNW